MNAEKEKPQSSCFREVHAGICKGSQFNVIMTLRNLATICNDKTEEMSWKEAHPIILGVVHAMWPWATHNTVPYLWILSIPIHKMGS